MRERICRQRERVSVRVYVCVCVSVSVSVCLCLSVVYLCFCFVCCICVFCLGDRCWSCLIGIARTENHVLYPKDRCSGKSKSAVHTSSSIEGKLLCYHGYYSYWDLLSIHFRPQQAHTNTRPHSPSSLWAHASRARSSYIFPTYDTNISVSLCALCFLCSLSLSLSLSLSVCVCVCVCVCLCLFLFLLQYISFSSPSLSLSPSFYLTSTLKTCNLCLHLPMSDCYRLLQQLKHTCAGSWSPDAIAHFILQLNARKLKRSWTLSWILKIWWISGCCMKHALTTCREASTRYEASLLRTVCACFGICLCICWCVRLSGDVNTIQLLPIHDAYWVLSCFALFL